MQTVGLNLVIPEKGDAERDRVAESWRANGGLVTRVGRFWDPPNLDRSVVRIYANDTFALVLAQKLSLHLISPVDDLLERLPHEHLRRRVRIATLGDAHGFAFPTFVKPIVPKQFRAGVYESWSQLEQECAGLGREIQVYESEVVVFDAEVRAFICNGQVLDAAFYEGTGSLSQALEFLSSVAISPELPATCVLDVGHIRGCGWAVIEANASWGAGLNGCNPDKVIESIANATRDAT